MNHDTPTRDEITAKTDSIYDVSITARVDEVENDQARTAPSRLNRKPSRLFDAMTASPRLSRVWLVISFVCLAIAAGCFWSLKFDAAFVFAALGVIAWFMNLRGRMKRKMEGDERKAEAK